MCDFRVSIYIGNMYACARIKKWIRSLEMYMEASAVVLCPRTSRKCAINKHECCAEMSTERVVIWIHALTANSKAWAWIEECIAKSCIYIRYVALCFWDGTICTSMTIYCFRKQCGVEKKHIYLTPLICSISWATDMMSVTGRVTRW